MTRFARAKGSKASNERVPEDATPWATMKEQLQKAKEDAEYSKRREEAEKKRIENYENFLKEQKTAKKKSTWCEFPMNNDWSVHNPIKKKNPINSNEHKSNNCEMANISNNDTVGSSGKKKNKKRENKDAFNEPDHTEIPQKKIKTHNELAKGDHTAKEQNSDITQISFNGADNSQPEQNQEFEGESNKKKNKKAKHNKQLLNGEDTKINLNRKDNSQPEQNQKFEGESNKKKKKNKKAKHNKELAQKQDVPHIAIVNSNDNNETGSSLISKPPHSEKKANKLGNNSGLNNNQCKQENHKKKKKDGNKNRRKPEGDNSFQIIINGRSMDLVRFEGFPVMKKDADRLKQLRQDMMKKGIPKREIERNMKLERRRAEKALARVKRDVCYNCRKGGHNLSDCPELRSRVPALDEPGAADGVCFKCGSTEHRQSECRVQKAQQFRFASCFICKEQGHIARQCPDNPKGLYPNGGACKLCGDVTHLRKDCPTTKTEREEATARLDTIATAVDNVEGIEAPVAMTTASAAAKKPKTIKY